MGRDGNRWILGLLLALTAGVVGIAVFRSCGQTGDPSGVQPGGVDASAPLADAAVDQTGPDPTAADRPPPASRTPNEFSVRVEDFAGHAIPGCEVFVWRKGEPGLLEEATDDEGTATFPAFGGHGGVLAVTAEGLHDSTDSIVLEGSQTLVIGGDVAVAGSILVDGQPADTGLRLELTTDLALSSSVPQSVTQRVQNKDRSTPFETSPGGYFAIRGLTADWRGGIRAPAAYWFAPSTAEPDWKPHRVAVAAPDSALLLHLTRLPTVLGRVVWDDDGTAIASARIVVRGAFADGVEATGTAETDQDGAFLVGLTPTRLELWSSWGDGRSRPELERIHVSCAPLPGSAGATEVERVGTMATETVLLRVLRAATKHFCVESTEGAPIAAASVDVKPSEATDVDGRGSYRGPVARLVGAPGYAVVPAQPADGDGSEQRPHRFVLPQRNEVRIRIDGVPPELSRLLTVTIESGSRLLVGERRWSRFDGEFGGSSWSGGSTRRTSPTGEVTRRQELTAVPDAGGGLLLHSMAPGIDCAVVARDILGHIVAENSFATPSFGTKADVVLLVTRPMRSLRGRVTEPEGVVVANAEVRLSSSSGSAVTLTDEEGRFAFTGVCTRDPLDLEARKPGFVTARDRVAARSEHAEDLDLRLARGRSVTVRVLDAGGDLVDLYPRPVGFEDGPSQTIAIGVYRWSDLPATVEFYTEVQGIRFSTWCASSVAEIDLQVPLLARVVAPLPRRLSQKPDSWFVELKSLDRPEAEVVRVPCNDGAVEPTIVLPGRYTAEVVERRVDVNGAVSFDGQGGAKTIQLLAGVRTELALE